VDARISMVRAVHWRSFLKLSIDSTESEALIIVTDCFVELVVNKIPLSVW
jgi:hypothetical protein